MTPNYDTWSEEEKRQVYFSLCAEVDKLRADAARLRSERDTLAKRVRELEAAGREVLETDAESAYDRLRTALAALEGEGR